MPVKVAVGSKNPVKVEAVRRAFEKAFGECEVVGVGVSSRVPDMPLGFDEMLLGAKNRARKAREKSDSDYSVGLEGGFEETSAGTFITGFAVVLSRDGKCGIGRGGGILVPEVVLRKVKEGREISVVMDEMLGRENIKHQEGTTGYLTKNIIDRTQGFEDAVVRALARFLRPEMYDQKG